MYVFINDLSINPPGVTIQDNWHLLDSIMDISFKLKEEYLLEKVRVPHNFMEMPIANSRTINDFLIHELLDPDEISSLLDFLANRTDEIKNTICLLISKKLMVLLNCTNIMASIWEKLISRELIHLEMQIRIITMTTILE